ncbi:hypothetical protein KC887_00835 [Candidatus Kaiserbacteria bacterium]|nr:hypothetical protein [Candidatus Kaiserbacteria bacterium]
MLTSSESQPLLEACIEEFAETLNSRVVSYPEGQVTNQSAGQLVLQTKASSFAAAARIPYRPQIVFTDERTGHKSAIASDGLTELSWYAEPLIAGHTLYYQSGYASTTRLEAVDLFAGTHRTLPVVYDPTTPIHSFYVTGDQLYYLTGEFCNEYMARCHDMNLHQYDLVTEVHAVLATTSASRRVMGLDGSGNIVLAMQEGDAGCGWGTFESYNTKTKTLDSVGSYNGCEAELEPAYAPYKNLTVGMTQTYAVQVTNGQLLPAVVDKPAREWTSIRVVTQ